MSLALTFFSDDFEYKHVCAMKPTLGLSFRSGVLGQYWQCVECGTTAWEPIPEENENSN